MNPITLLTTQLAILSSLFATGGPFNALTLRLYATNVIFGKGTALTDLTEATFTGYTAQAAVAWNAPYIDPLNVVRMDAPSVDWQMTGATPTNTIYGWYYTNSGGTSLYMGGTFNPPYVLQTTGQGFVQVPTFAYGN